MFARRMLEPVSFAALIFAITILGVAQNETVATRKEGFTVYVGILEDDRNELVNWKPGPAKTRVVRPVFVRDEFGWHLLQALTQTSEWTIAFDGTTLGSVQSKPREATMHWESGVHDLSSKAAVPDVGQPSTRFGGSLGMIVRRPLVVVSKPNYKDPDQWKRKHPSAELAKQAREHFRKAFPHVKNCDKEGNLLKADWKYSDFDIQLTDVYGSKAGSYLVHTLLKDSHCDYLDDPNDPFIDQWFFIHADGKTSRLGAFMELVDAGD